MDGVYVSTYSGVGMTLITCWLVGRGIWLLGNRRLALHLVCFVIGTLYRLATARSVGPKGRLWQYIGLDSFWGVLVCVITKVYKQYIVLTKLYRFDASVLHLHAAYLNSFKACESRILSRTNTFVLLPVAQAEPSTHT